MIWQRKILPGQFVLFLSSLFSKYRRRNKKRFAFFYRNTMGDRINVLLQILSNDREKFSILLFVSRTILQVIHHQWCLFSDRRHEYILTFCKIRHLWSKLNTNQNSFFQMLNVPLIKTYIIVSDFLRWKSYVSVQQNFDIYWQEYTDILAISLNILMASK